MSTQQHYTLYVWTLLLATTSTVHLINGKVLWYHPPSYKLLVSSFDGAVGPRDGGRSLNLCLPNTPKLALW